jgi:hypothetical protein
MTEFVLFKDKLGGGTQYVDDPELVEVYINPDHVTAIQRMGKITAVFMSDGKVHNIYEYADMVYSKLWDASQ